MSYIPSTEQHVEKAKRLYAKAVEGYNFSLKWEDLSEETKTHWVIWAKGFVEHERQPKRP